MTDVFAKFAPSLDAIVSFHKANFEALAQAQSVFAKGFQEISKELVAQAQSHLESNAAGSKSAFAAKTFKDAAEINVDGAKASIERLVAGATRLGELSMEVSSKAMTPVASRAAAAVETLLRPLTA